MRKGQVQYTHLCLQAASPDTGRQEEEVAWGWARDDCTYFSSTIFIENVQMCKWEINVLNSLWASFPVAKKAPRGLLCYKLATRGSSQTGLDT